MKNPKEQVSLYFHIPFCTRKCDYCHFYVLPDKDPLKIALMDGLKLEWQRQLHLLKEKEIVSIYFGGGTPYLLGPERMHEILNWINQSVSISKSVEITLEANPENITLETMKTYKDIGINRVSIGIQTLDNPLLQSLGRLHNANKGIEAVHTTKAAGIDNISIDLMYDLPKQTLEIWEKTIIQIAELPITHLSLYNLTIEPHTVFFKYREKLKDLIPDAETSLQMYENGIKALESIGLKQYEISAFARNDCYSRHNTGYWLARPFLGYGPSAFSYWEGRRFRNVANLTKYLHKLEIDDSPIDFDEILTDDAHKRELFVIAIRIVQGVDLGLFQKRHGKLDAEMLVGCEKLLQDGLLESEGSILRLSKRGILFYDTVAETLI